MPTWPSPRSEQLGTSDPPAIRFHAGHVFRGFWFTHLLRPVRLLAPCTDRTGTPSPRGPSRLSTARSPPVAGYVYNSDWTSSVGGTFTRWNGSAGLAAPGTVRAAFPHTACMGLLLSRGHHTVFCRAVASFFCSTRAASILPSRPHITIAVARSEVKDGASSAPPKACP